VSNPSTSDVLENSLPYVEISDPKTNKWNIHYIWYVL
jgi:hypothetical protein